MFIQKGDEAEEELGIKASQDGTYVCDNCKSLIGDENDCVDNWGRYDFWYVNDESGDIWHFCSKLCMIEKLKLTKEEAIAERI